MLGCCWCVWGHAGATSSMGSVGALEMCMEGLSELERSTGVPEFVHGSSPAPPQLLTCCSPFPGNFRGESRITNPFIHGSNLVLWKSVSMCVWMFAPSVPFPAAQSEISVSFAHLSQVPVVVLHDIAQVFPTGTHQYMGTGVSVQCR